MDSFWILNFYFQFPIYVFFFKDKEFFNVWIFKIFVEINFMKQFAHNLIQNHVFNYYYFFNNCYDYMTNTKSCFYSENILYFFLFVKKILKLFVNKKWLFLHGIKPDIGNFFIFDFFPIYLFFKDGRIGCYVNDFSRTYIW